MARMTREQLYNWYSEVFMKEYYMRGAFGGKNIRHIHARKSWKLAQLEEMYEVNSQAIAQLNNENESEQQQAQAELNTYVDQQAKEVAPEMRREKFKLTIEERKALGLATSNREMMENMEKAGYPFPTQAPTTDNSEPAPTPQPEIHNSLSSDTLIDLRVATTCFLNKATVNGKRQYTLDSYQAYVSSKIGRELSNKEIYRLTELHNDGGSMNSEAIKQYFSTLPLPQANNTVSFRKPKAPRRVSRRAARFFSMLAA